MNQLINSGNKIWNLMHSEQVKCNQSLIDSLLRKDDDNNVNGNVIAKFNVNGQILQNQNDQIQSQQSKHKDFNDCQCDNYDNYSAVGKTQQLLKMKYTCNDNQFCNDNLQQEGKNQEKQIQRSIEAKVYQKSASFKIKNKGRIKTETSKRNHEEKYQIKSKKYLPLFKNQQLNQKFNLIQIEDDHIETYEGNSQQMQCLPTHKLKYNKKLQRSPQTQISQKMNVSLFLKGQKKRKIKMKMTKRSQLNIDLQLQQQNIRKNQQIQRILLQERISNERLKRLYSKKRQLYVRLQQLNQEVNVIKQNKNKEQEFKRRLEFGRNSNTNSRIYQNPQSRVKKLYVNQSVTSKNKKKKYSIQNCTRAKCITQIQQNEIQKSRHAIDFILSIRRCQKQRRIKLQQSLKRMKEKDKQNDFSRLQDLNRKSALLPVTH